MAIGDFTKEQLEAELSRRAVEAKVSRVDALVRAVRDAVLSMNTAGDGRVLRKDGLALETVLKAYDSDKNSCRSDHECG